MQGKRKREERFDASTPAKPLSAIAAARLRAEASTTTVVSSKTGQDAVVQVPEAVLDSPALLKDESEEEETERVVAAQNLKLCNWRNNTQDSLEDTTTQLSLILNKHTTVAVLGCYQLKVLKGAININGANIAARSAEGSKAQSYTVFAPTTNPVSKIRGLDVTSHVQLTHITDSLLLSRISPSFNNIWAERRDRLDQRSFRIVCIVQSIFNPRIAQLIHPQVTDSNSATYDQPLVPEKTPEEWLRTIETCATVAGINVITGPSSSGKSTFAKRLVNRMLTGQGRSARPAPEVCYLDLDHEKPEYVPPGEISLVTIRDLNLGPNFTHVSLPSSTGSSLRDEVVRAHPIPTCHGDYMAYYQACLDNLIATYQNLRSINPSLCLVVDIPGHLYTTNFDLISSLISRLKPHSTIHMDNAEIITSDVATKLHALQTQAKTSHSTVYEITSHLPPHPSIRLPFELRQMHIQSYFHSIISIDTNLPTWNPEPISSWVPWEFCYQETDDRLQDFLGFVMYTESIEPSSLVHSLNGSIVKIVELNSSSHRTISRTMRTEIPYFAKDARSGLVEPFAPSVSKLVCTALVRGFDLKKKIIQVLVPEVQGKSLNQLSNDQVVFVGGCCDTPEWAFLEGAETEQSRPWVEKGSVIEDMGYLGTIRRVRKFQT